MSKITTGGGDSLTTRLKREISELYEPSKAELKAKHTFYHRLKHGVWSGTPKAKWSREFVIEVTGTSIDSAVWADPKFKAWFFNENSYEETKASTLEGAMQVIQEVMHNPAEKAGDRLRAAEMALKLNKAFEAEDNSRKGHGLTDAEIKALEAQGIDIKLVTQKR